MSTKLKPGTWDCYRAALPDEPLFILLARDTSAPRRLREWADQRRQELIAEKLARPDIDDDAWLARFKEDMAKCRDADAIAHDMTVWRTQHDGEWRQASVRTAMGEINPAIRDAVAEVTRNRLCSFLVAGTGSVQLIEHKTRAWTIPGFNVRVHEFEFGSAGEAFAPLLDGRALAFTEWKIAGFDVMLGDVEHLAADANTLFVRLQTVEAA